MNNLLFVLLMATGWFTFPVTAFAQGSPGSYTLQGCVIHAVIRRDGRTVTEVPAGNDAAVTYDRFFRRYRVSYVDADGRRHTDVYSYIQPGLNGTARYRDGQGFTYLLHDLIGRDRRILLLPEVEMIQRDAESTIVITCP